MATAAEEPEVRYRPMRGNIVPKSKAKGVDFCGVDKYYYIIRSDLGCFMRSSKFNYGDDLDVFSLHPSCMNGDHYAAFKLDIFYIIFEDHYRVVTNLNTDEHAAVYPLHPNCRGGDHYLSAWDYFFIIFKERGVLRRTFNLHHDDYGQEFKLHPNCRDGIYYFGIANFYYFVKALDDGRIQYVKSTNFETNEIRGAFPFHYTVLNFLPGGLAHTFGQSYGQWICIDTIVNDSDSVFQGEKSITKKTGFEKDDLSIEKNWKVYATFPPETGGLAALLVKHQLSLSAEYGGVSVNTDQECWNPVTEHAENIPIALEPGEKLNVWTYQFGFGRIPALHCRVHRVLPISDQPNDIPFTLL